jgi:hypothetical protein
MMENCVIEVKRLEEYPIGSMVTACINFCAGHCDMTCALTFVTGKIVRRFVVEDISPLSPMSSPWVQKITVAVTEQMPATWKDLHPDTLATSSIKDYQKYLDACVKFNEAWNDDC